MRWRPPMVMVSSARSPPSSLILLSSAARSGLPGGYCRNGSLTGDGTLVTASMAKLPALPDIVGGHIHRRMPPDPPAAERERGQRAARGHGGQQQRAVVQR